MFLTFTYFSIIIVCVAAIVLRVRGIRLAYIWLLLFLVVLTVWMIVVLAKPAAVQPFVIPGYFKLGSESVDLVFRMTAQNKIAGIGVLSLMLAYLATETAHPRGNLSLYHWIETLMYTSAVWVVLFSGNAWTVLIAWTVLDITSLISDFIYRHRSVKEFAPYYLSKFAGSMILVFIISRTYQTNPQSLLGGQIPNIGLWTLLAVFLHTGLIFNERSQNNQSPEEDKHLIIIRILIFLANFYLLTQVPVLRVSPLLRVVLQVALLVGSVVTAVRWHQGKDERDRVNDLLGALACMCGYLFLSEIEGGLIYFLVALLPIIWIFLYTERFSWFTPFWSANLIFISGLPFSLNYASIENLLLRGALLEAAATVLPMAVLLAGTYRFVKKPRGDFEAIEKLNQGVYGFGLFMPLAGIIIIQFSNLPATRINSLWFGGLQLIVFTLLVFAESRAKKDQPDSIVKFTLPQVLKDSRTQIIRTYRTVIDVVGGGLHFAALLLEGEGGILWSIVFLSLLLTVIAFQGGIS